MQTINTALDEFWSADEVARLSVSSRKVHRVALGVLKRVAGASKPVARLTRSDIDAALSDRRSNGVSATTLNAYRGSLRQFGKWLADRHYVKTDPAAHLRNTKTVVARSKRKPLTVEQLRAMIQLAGERHPRDRAALVLLAYTGCRASEVVGLRWQDVDLDAGVLVVFRPKVRDYLTLPMPTELRAELEKWRAWVAETHGNVDGRWYVVPAVKSRGFDKDHVPLKMSPDWPLNPTKPHTTLREVIKKLMVSVGVTDLHGKGAHTIRRTAANLILDATGDIRAAQTLLGHRSVSQTEEYLDADAQAAKYGAMIRGWTI